MSKQDRQGVRTPADVERKYNLGQLAAAQGKSQKQELAIAQLTQAVNQYMVSNNVRIEELNGDIDKLNEGVNDSLDAMNGTIDNLNKDIDELNRKIEELPDNPDGEGGSGVSPTIDVTDIEGGHRVTITDAEGTESFDVMDGKNGADGYTPVKDKDYFDGKDGAKGDKGDKGDPGSDAEVTKANVISALGYTPADASLFVEDTAHPGCYYRMVSGVKEWLNPPWEMATEYRLTERYNGKVVYGKMFDIGNFPATSSKTVATGINGSKAVSSEPIIYMASGGITPYPFIDAKGASMVRIYLATNGSIYVTSFADVSGGSAKYKIKYVKD